MYIHKYINIVYHHVIIYRYLRNKKKNYYRYLLPVALCISVQAGGKSILELAEASRKMQDFRGGQHGNGLTLYGLKYVCIYCVHVYTSSTAQGGGGSFKNKKAIGEVGCCESRMAEQPLMDRKVIDVSSLCLSFCLFL